MDEAQLFEAAPTEVGATTHPGTGEPEASAIGRHAGRGLGWTLVGGVAFKVGSFVMSLVMVRLLAPQDFGLYAVALAANAFVIHVNDMGIIAATVQWTGDVKRMASTARTMALAFSLSWYAVFWTVAPLLADAASSPDATPLVRLLTLTIVLDGLTAVSVGVMQRRFQQDKLMKAIAVGFIFNAIVGITLAASGAGAYSFVLGSLTQSLVVAVLVLRVASLPYRFGFDRAIARRLFRFGAPLALGLGIESILLFSDSFIVGHLLGTEMLGFYLLAFNISSWVPGIVGTAVRYVSIPAFARLAEGEADGLTLAVQRSLPVMISVVAPIAAVMAVLSPQLVSVLYGVHWERAGDALAFLALVMVARMFTGLVFDIQTGRGKTQVTIWLNLTWLIFLVPTLWIGASIGGMRGAAAGHAIVALVVAIPMAAWMLHTSGVDMRPVVRRLARPIVGAVTAALVMHAVAIPLDGPLVQLVVAGGIGGVVYLLVAFPASALASVSARAWAWARSGWGRAAQRGAST
ncbi:MAG: oligosaccharide flippase family protein [Nocardioides sp.]|uniref:oligosaccharide flippase family protein n=1 Tax=Nocardioides sp. TaxID=35761 RepID=UPI003266ACBC